MRILYILTGISGSGKTTFAKEFANKNNLTLVSSDEIRYEKYGPNFLSSNTAVVYDILVQRTNDALDKNKDVIVDSPMFSKENRKYFINLFAGHYEKVISIFINTPLNICIERNKSKRHNWQFDRLVPIEFIEKSFKRLEKPEKEEGFDECIEIQNKLRIGVFGGTFDPIHIGHVNLIKNIKEEFDLDKVYVIPAGNPYQKTKVTDFDTRFEMTKIATKSLPYVEVLDIEKNDKNSYTYNTMSKLKQIEDNDYFLICGSDCIFNIESFYNYEKLLKKFSFIVIPRNEERQNINNKINSLVYKDIFISNYIGENISSSMIRSDFNKYQNYLDKNVLDFIKNKNIY